MTKTTPAAILANGAIYKQETERLGINIPSEVNLGTTNGDTFKFKRILRVPFTSVTLWLMRLQ